MWESKAWPDEPLGPGWTAAFADWIAEFGLPRVADALQMACKPRISEHGERRPPDIRDIPKYAAVERAEDREPGAKACYLVRGRMRVKFYSSEHDDEVLDLLKRLMRSGLTESAMNEAVDETDTLEDCLAAMGLDRTEFRIALGHPIVEFGVKGGIFVRTEDPEWRIWDGYLRRTTGKGAPISRRGGWYFPSRLPPPDPVQKRSRR